MTKFHLFSQDLVRLETAPTGGVRKSCSCYTISKRLYRIDRSPQRLHRLTVSYATKSSFIEEFSIRNGISYRLSVIS